jgi:hypothetical protein
MYLITVWFFGGIVNFVQIVSFFYSNISLIIRKEKTVICTSHVKTKHKENQFS